MKTLAHNMELLYDVTSGDPTLGQQWILTIATRSRIPILNIHTKGLNRIRSKTPPHIALPREELAKGQLLQIGAMHIGGTMIAGEPI